MNVRHIRPLDAVARREYHLYLPAKASPSERQTEDASHAETRSTMGTNRQFSTRHSFIASSCLSVRLGKDDFLCVCECEYRPMQIKREKRSLSWLRDMSGQSGFLTPHFTLSQDADFVIVRIRLPHLLATSEGEFYVDG